MKAIPHIKKYMTTLPHSIGTEQTLAQAEKMMDELDVRHLPVVRGEKLVGVLTDRDINFVESFRDVSPETVTVEEAFAEHPYIVSPEASLAEVCSEMASKKYGCAIVCDNNKLVGIFTWIDALIAMNQLLETRLKP
jgi:acetoin utilization protein AcuB